MIDALTYNGFWFSTAWLACILGGIIWVFNRYIVLGIFIGLIVLVLGVSIIQLSTIGVPEYPYPWFYGIGSFMGGLTYTIPFNSGKRLGGQLKGD